MNEANGHTFNNKSACKGWTRGDLINLSIEIN